MTLNIVDRPETAPAWAQTASAGDIERPSDAFISAGWVQSAEPPYRQYFNWILGYSAQIGRYLMQNGIASWDADETYPPGAVVLHEGKLWVAQRENHGVPPGTSQADWGGSSGIIVDDSGNDLMTLIEQLREKDTALDAKDADLQAQIDQLKNSSGGGGVIPPSPGDHSLDAGFWRIIVGTGVTITGYLDTVTMPKPLGAVLAIGVTEANAEGWGAPGPNGEVTSGVTAFATAPHPDPDKFRLSVAIWDVTQSKWFYPGLAATSGSVSIQYIAIGENPDYVPPTPAP